MMNHSSKKVFFGLVFTIVLTIAAIAQNSTEQKVEFSVEGKVGTEVVKQGAHKVVIPNSDQGIIEIKVGKKVIAAQFVKRTIEKVSEKDKMTYIENSDGTRSLASITPRGRKYTLVLNESTGNVANGK